MRYYVYGMCIFHSLFLFTSINCETMEIVISTLEKVLNLRPADDILQKIAGIDSVSNYCNKHLCKKCLIPMLVLNQLVKMLTDFKDKNARSSTLLFYQEIIKIN